MHGNQNMQFGTFQDQSTTSPTTNNPQQSTQQNVVGANNQQNQKSAAQNQGTNSNQNIQDTTLIPVRK